MPLRLRRILICCIGLPLAAQASTEEPAAAEHATDGQTVNSDIHGDREYRARMAVVLTRRAIEAALGR